MIAQRLESEESGPYITQSYKSKKNSVDSISKQNKKSKSKSKDNENLTNAKRRYSTQEIDFSVPVSSKTEQLVKSRNTRNLPVGEYLYEEAKKQQRKKEK